MSLCQGFRLLFDANIPGAIMHGGEGEVCKQSSDSASHNFDHFF